MRRWASVLIRGVVQETPAPRRPACPARESGTAVPDKRTKAVPGDEPRDHSPFSITFVKPSRILRGRLARPPDRSQDNDEYFFLPFLSVASATFSANTGVAWNANLVRVLLHSQLHAHVHVYINFGGKVCVFRKPTHSKLIIHASNNRGDNETAISPVVQFRSISGHFFLCSLLVSSKF